MLLGMINVSFQGSVQAFISTNSLMNPRLGVKPNSSAEKSSATWLLWTTWKTWISWLQLLAAATVEKSGLACMTILAAGRGRWQTMATMEPMSPSSGGSVVYQIGPDMSGSCVLLYKTVCWMMCHATANTPFSAMTIQAVSKTLLLVVSVIQ